MRIATKTDIGKVRSSNQDAYSVGELSGGAAWAVVCDGMGGASGGNIASATAVRIISEHIASSYREDMSPSSIKSMLKSAIYAANISVFDMQNSVESLAGMGTTVVVAIVSGHMAHIAHAGDSRAYLVSEAELSQITKDHSIVQNMIESGQLTPEEAKYHPRKNVITRALGVNESVDIDYNEIPIKPDQALMICTDGLTNYVDKARMIEILNKSEFSKCPQILIDEANSNGGGDNITVVLVKE